MKALVVIGPEFPMYGKYIVLTDPKSACNCMTSVKARWYKQPPKGTSIKPKFVKTVKREGNLKFNRKKKTKTIGFRSHYLWLHVSPPFSAFCQKRTSQSQHLGRLGLRQFVQVIRSWKSWWECVRNQMIHKDILSPCTSVDGNQKSGERKPTWDVIKPS